MTDQHPTPKQWSYLLCVKREPECYNLYSICNDDDIVVGEIIGEDNAHRIVAAVNAIDKYKMCTECGGSKTSERHHMYGCGCDDQPDSNSEDKTGVDDWDIPTDEYFKNAGSLE